MQKVCATPFMKSITMRVKFTVFQPCFSYNALGFTQFFVISGFSVLLKVLCCVRFLVGLRSTQPTGRFNFYF